MRDYNKAKIYKIEYINGGDVGDVYFGSTTEDHLSQRMAHHRYVYERWKKGNTKRHCTSATDLFDKYGLENCQIILVENVLNCKSKDEMLAREKFYIKSNECINKNIPTRTQKEWMEENQEKMKETKRKYQQEHKNELKEKKAIYYQKNQEKLSEQKKQYRQLHDEEIKSFKNAQFICECGMQYTHSNKSRHCKTKRHQAFLCNINV